MRDMPWPEPHARREPPRARAPSLLAREARAEAWRAMRALPCRGRQVGADHAASADGAVPLVPQPQGSVDDARLRRLSRRPALRARAAVEPCLPRGRLRPRARRPRRICARSVRDVSRRGFLRELPWHHRRRASVEARLRSSEPDRSPSRWVRVAPLGRGALEPGALHDVSRQRALLSRLPREARALCVRWRDLAEPASARLGSRAWRRARTRRAHGSDVVRELSRRRGRGALRRLPPRRWSRR